MSYNLNQNQDIQGKKPSTFASLKKLTLLIGNERRNLILAFIAIFINAWLSLLGPFMVGYTIDHYVAQKQYHGIILFASILLGVYVIAFVFNYLQMIMMGGIGQRLLYSLRNAVFNKLQSLPLEFFNQNKSGDLISRINNDTDKVNQFFSQSLMQFIGSIFTMVGSAIFLLGINFKLGLAILMPALLVWIFTKFITPWVKKLNAASLKSTGGLSAEIQESLANFKVIVAFNRRDYFKQKFNEANTDNYNKAVKAGYANNLLMPVYTLASNIGQLIVLAMGIYLIIKGEFTIGLLMSFIAYSMNFYHPLRQLAMLWANFQVALAAWDRISNILVLENNLITLESTEKQNITEDEIMRFDGVSFSYPNGKEVLHEVSFTLEKGKTYAFVGPTGGGKTTTASLTARLFDASKGNIYLLGKDIRTYSPEERTQKIGFILQEPLLFGGSVRDNILYGNDKLTHLSSEELSEVISNAGLQILLDRFENGLETQISNSSDGISLGQKQLIAFMRAVLRKPEILILDEATANIDTITEQLLEEILKKLPQSTTLVIIAHRLNTIENADEIFFVNTGEVTRAGSMQDAVRMLMEQKNES